jgi:CelD/BcsL family acetyltransferase involved in cellulose biosynthesis
MTGSRPPWINFRPLSAEDAAQIAALEKRVYGPAYRAGADSLSADIGDAEYHGENFSVGLFDRRRLVGCAILFYQHDRTEVFSDFGVDKPADLPVPGQSVYFSDIILLPPYREYFPQLMRHWSAEVRRHCPGLPIDAFAVASVLQRWQRARRFLAKLGYRLTARRQIEDPSLHEPLHWLSFSAIDKVPVPAPTVREHTRGSRRFRVEMIETRDQWERISTEWNALLANSPAGTPFLTYEYLSAWWDTFHAFNELFIVTVRENDRLIGALPLQITTGTVYGGYFRYLEFLGHPEELDRPALITVDSETVPQLVTDVLLEQRDRWDILVAYEQQPHAPFTGALRDRLCQAGLVMGALARPSAPYLTLDRNWDAYLATRSAGKRKQVRRRLNQLRKLGRLTMTTVDTWPEVIDALQRYDEVEQRSWKTRQPVGVRTKPGRWHFFRQLVRRLGPLGQVHFRFLELDGNAIAATFGIIHNRRYASLHIAHDEGYRKYSPGVVLTALELEACFTRPEYVEFDFLGGFPNNKDSWATGTRPTVTLHFYGQDPRLRFMHWVYFRLKPALKTWLGKLGLLAPAVATLRFLKRPGNPARGSLAND